MKQLQKDNQMLRALNIRLLEHVTEAMGIGGLLTMREGETYIVTIAARHPGGTT
jgi:hypothetical protein